MVALGPTPFAVLVWGALLGVFLVFCYEVYVLGGTAGWPGW
jgi:hypothetical protein